MRPAATAATAYLQPVLHNRAAKAPKRLQTYPAGPFVPWKWPEEAAMLAANVKCTQPAPAQHMCPTMCWAAKLSWAGLGLAVVWQADRHARLCLAMSGASKSRCQVHASIQAMRCCMQVAWKRKKVGVCRRRRRPAGGAAQSNEDPDGGAPQSVCKCCTKLAATGFGERGYALQYWWLSHAQPVSHAVLSLPHHLPAPKCLCLVTPPMDRADGV